MDVAQLNKWLKKIETKTKRLKDLKLKNSGIKLLAK